MAEHNQARITGYLINDPIISGEENAWQVWIKVRTIHRSTEDYFENRTYEDIIVYCDDNQNTELMNLLRSLIAFDLVDVKGVFCVMAINKPSVCPNCHMQNIRYNGGMTVIYPIYLSKIGNLAEDYKHNENLPTEVLQRHFREVSNQVLLLGTLIQPPRLAGTQARPCCQYPLGIDRKYYIRTQSDITSDYPWIYSFGKQALKDIDHLRKGSVVLIDAFLRTRPIKTHMTCAVCQTEYTFPDVAMEFVPYAVEYLRDYYTDEDLANKKKEQERKDAIINRQKMGF